jgi:hypothetical protein
VLVVIDVTERKRAERALASAERASRTRRTRPPMPSAAATSARPTACCRCGARSSAEVQAGASRAKQPPTLRGCSGLVDIRVVVGGLHAGRNAVAAGRHRGARKCSPRSVRSLQLDLQALPVVDWAVRDLFRISRRRSATPSATLTPRT